VRIPRGGEERPVLLPRDMYMYLKTGRQAGRQTGRQADRQTDRQRER
jgi:hypothetical protein